MRITPVDALPEKETGKRLCVRVQRVCSSPVCSARQPRELHFLRLGLLWLQRWPVETLHCWSLFTAQTELAKGTGEKGEG